LHGAWQIAIIPNIQMLITAIIKMAVSLLLQCWASYDSW
jgi:hypothetical protein